MDGTSHDQRLDKRGKQFFSRAGFPAELPARRLICLPGCIWAGCCTPRCSRPPDARARPHAGDCFYFPLLFESRGGRRGRMRGRSADDGWAIAPRRGRQPGAGRAPPCRLHLARSMVPLTERAAAPPQNGALASRSRLSLTPSPWSGKERRPIRGTVTWRREGASSVLVQVAEKHKKCYQKEAYHNE